MYMKLNKNLISAFILILFLPLLPVIYIRKETRFIKTITELLRNQIQLA